MKRWIIFFLLIALYPPDILGDQQLQNTDFVAPQQVKRTNFSKRSTLKAGDSKLYSPLTPKIHRKLWPEFCLQHLLEDPEGCSAWTQDKEGNLQLAFLCKGSSANQTDRKLTCQLDHLIYLIPINYINKKKYCDYAKCTTCNQTVVRALSREEDDSYDDIEYRYFVVYKCGCTGKWWLELDNLDNEDYEIYKGWRFCKSPTIYQNYLEWHHQTYFRHLKNFLVYAEENPQCNCFWPQVDIQAKTISDIAYETLGETFEFSELKLFQETFSPYLIHRSRHGFLTGLLTHAFFYSHYREILFDLDQFCFKEFSPRDYSSINSDLKYLEEEIQEPFLTLYNQCLQKHPHPKIYYERGMVLFHRGENLDSLEDIYKFIAYAENNNYQDLLNSELYLTEGRLLSESLSYDEAIVALTRAIQIDPKNAEAYFERAIAYFETGDFSKALSDYLASGIHPKKIDPKQVGKVNYVTFGQGMALGMITGGQDSLTEFVPSLLGCFRGISRGIWACVSSPIAVSKDIIDCANACLEFIEDNTTRELLCKLVPELQECLKNWRQLEDYAKGKYVGHVIGKYGVDIFIGAGSLKAIQLYRNLRRANALMTLETASISPKLAQEVLAQAAKEEAMRSQLLKSGNLKIQWDKQAKHLPGKHNYQHGKSILEHRDPQKLVNEFAGTGIKTSNSIPGTPGYREIVNFKEHIGYHANRETGEKISTTWGKIHYAKDGVHIVPTLPRK